MMGFDQVQRTLLEENISQWNEMKSLVDVV
jgi:hypothetical protein